MKITPTVLLTSLLQLAQLLNIANADEDAYKIQPGDVLEVSGSIQS